jgi:hypothetical protein
MLNFEEYRIFENIKQAKAYLASKDIPAEKNQVLDTISELLKKKPNLIANFVKYHYEENVSLADLTDFVQYMTINKATLDKLPKPVFEYDKFEHIQDDLRVVERGVAANKLYSYLHPELRNDINNLPPDSKNELDSLVLDYMALPKEKRDAFTPLKFFRKNRTTLADFTTRMQEFIMNLDSGRSKIEQELEKHTGKYETIYDKDNILIIKGNDKDLVKDIGSEKWCIVYAQESYYDRYLSPSSGNTHYTVFNFNYSLTSRYGRFGVTIGKKGTPVYGGCQDNLNSETNIEHIAKTLAVDDIELSLMLTNDYTKKVQRLTQAAKECHTVPVFKAFTQELLVLQEKGFDSHALSDCHTIAVQSLLDAKLFFPNFDDISEVLGEIGYTEHLVYAWEDAQPHLTEDLTEYMVNNSGYFLDNMGKNIPLEVLIEHFSGFVVESIIAGSSSFEVSWKVFLGLIKKTDGAGAHDVIADALHHLIPAYSNDDDFIDYLIEAETVIDFDYDHDCVEYPDFYVNYTRKSGGEPTNTIEALLIYKKTGEGKEALMEHLGIKVTETGEPYYTYDDLDELCELYANVSTFEFDNYYDGDNDLDYVKFNFMALKRIVNILIGIGYEFDTAVIAELESEDTLKYDVSQTQDLVRNHPDLKAIVSKIDDIITKGYTPTDSEEEENEIDKYSADDLIDTLNTAYNRALEQASDGGMVDDALNKLGDAGFDVWNDTRTYTRYTIDGVSLKPDLGTIIPNLEYIADLKKDYDNDFTFDRLVYFYVEQQVGWLNVYFSDYYTFEDDDFNDILLNELGEAFNESVVYTFRNFVKMLK